MVKNLFFLILITSFIYSCGNQGDKNTVNDKSLEAFQKVDNKKKVLFTKEDRQKKYEESIALRKKTRTSLAENVTYSGYGASSSTKKSTSTKKDKDVKESFQKKKIKYNSKSLNSQVYSAYSTN